MMDLCSTSFNNCKWSNQEVLIAVDEAHLLSACKLDILANPHEETSSVNKPNIFLSAVKTEHLPKSKLLLHYVLNNNCACFMQALCMEVNLRENPHLWQSKFIPYHWQEIHCVLRCCQTCTSTCNCSQITWPQNVCLL